MFGLQGYKQNVAALADKVGSADVQQHIYIDGHTIRFPAINAEIPEITYIPEPTPEKFHSSRASVRLLLGCYGSGKTSAAIAEIILLAAGMPKCTDGVRRCHVALIRNTYGELETTTIRSWDDWTGGRFKVISRKMKPPITMQYEINDGDGIINLQLTFLSLNRDEDIGKVKSLETTFIFVNEACEIPFGLVSHLVGRTGRYPSEKTLPPGSKYWAGVIMDTNPPSMRHAIYQLFEVKRDPDWELFKQPPALMKLEDGTYVGNPEAENIKHHTKGYNYYLDMIKGATEEFIKVYALGQYGLVRSGKLVYPNYNDDLHSVEKIDPVPNEEIFIGWDFGTVASAAVIAQKIDGRICVIKELITDRESFETFAKDVVIPYIQTTFKDCPYTSIADPAGAAENYANLSSGVKILNELGFATRVARTNKIKDRIESVLMFLDKMRGGKPSLLISRTGCPILREGFLGMYKYRTLNVISDNGEQKTTDVPDKSHPHSEPQDCLQYICMDFNIFLDDNSNNSIRPDQLIPNYNSMWA